HSLAPATPAQCSRRLVPRRRARCGQGQSGRTAARAEAVAVVVVALGVATEAGPMTRCGVGVAAAMIGAERGTAAAASPTGTPPSDDEEEGDGARLACREADAAAAPPPLEALAQGMGNVERGRAGPGAAVSPRAAAEAQVAGARPALSELWDAGVFVCGVVVWVGRVALVVLVGERGVVRLTVGARVVIRSRGLARVLRLVGLVFWWWWRRRRRRWRRRWCWA
ncbi:hypothetical protein BJ546DRAFT_1126653, partial [Cryomyces antarcticus]